MEFKVQTSKKEEIIDITEKVGKLIDGKTGKACLIYVPHATCSVLINENYDPLVCKDILDFLKKQIPAGIWKHDKIDNNADAHIKSSIIGPGQIIPIKDGKLGLGRWQGIGLAEFDGPRERRIIVEILD